MGYLVVPEVLVEPVLSEVSEVSDEPDEPVDELMLVV